MSSVYANFKSFEGTVTTSVSHTFAWKTRVVTLVNDSATRDLNFRFKEDTDWGTLKPKETVQFEIWIRDVYLQAAGEVPYRVWGVG